MSGRDTMKNFLLIFLIFIKLAVTTTEKEMSECSNISSGKNDVTRTPILIAQRQLGDKTQDGATSANPPGLKDYDYCGFKFFSTPTINISSMNPHNSQTQQIFTISYPSSTSYQNLADQEEILKKNSCVLRIQNDDEDKSSSWCTFI
jgi:hypothetical protein